VRSWPVGQAQQVEQVASPGLGLAAGAPAMIAGMVTFSSTLIPSSRLKNWNTIPM